MGIVAIDSSMMRAQSGASAKKGFGVDDFSATMMAIAPAGAEIAAQSGGSAAVTHAAITGVAGASQAYGYSGPYGGAGISPASYPIEPVPGTTPIPGSQGGAYYGSTSSQSFQEGSALLQAMNDSNMKMLTLQSSVQDLNREFTVLSNVLQSKHQTEINAVRNMRVG